MASGDGTAGRSRTGHALVVGVGAVDRGDDAVGLLVADRVAALRMPRVAVHRVDGSPLGLLSLWCADDDVILIDAVRDTATAGTIRRVDVRRGPPVGSGAGGAHDASLAQTLALARVLGRLPRSVVLFGVAGRRFGVGARPSREVIAAVDDVVDLICGELGRSSSASSVTDTARAPRGVGPAGAGPPGASSRAAAARPAAGSTG